MVEYDFLIENVHPKEFTEIKSQESKLVEKAKTSFNVTWQPKVKEINVTFKYNLNRNMIGIYLEKDGRYQLADSESLNEAEEALADSLYTELETELSKSRLPNERWVDEI